MGMLPARSGSFSFAREVMDRLPVHDRVARGLRLLPEGRGIFPDLTVGENVDLVAARAVAGGHALFRVADVYTALDGRRDARAGSLSGRQQQMLALGLRSWARHAACCWTSRRSAWRRTWWSACSIRCATCAGRTAWPQSWSSRLSRRRCGLPTGS
jgi:hypothetical protein